MQGGNRTQDSQALRLDIGKPLISLRADFNPFLGRKIPLRLLGTRYIY